MNNKIDIRIFLGLGIPWQLQGNTVWQQGEVSHLSQSLYHIHTDAQTHYYWKYLGINIINHGTYERNQRRPKKWGDVQYQKTQHSDFPRCPLVKNPPSNAGDVGSIPGQGTKILHATGQLSPHVTTTELTYLNERAHVLQTTELVHPGPRAPQIQRSPRATTKSTRRNERFHTPQRRPRTPQLDPTQPKKKKTHHMKDINFHQNDLYQNQNPSRAFFVVIDKLILKHYMVGQKYYNS